MCSAEGSRANAVDERAEQTGRSPVRPVAQGAVIVRWLLLHNSCPERMTAGGWADGNLQTGNSRRQQPAQSRRQNHEKQLEWTET